MPLIAEASHQSSGLVRGRPAHASTMEMVVRKIERIRLGVVICASSEACGAWSPPTHQRTMLCGRELRGEPCIRQCRLPSARPVKSLPLVLTAWMDSIQAIRQFHYANKDDVDLGAQDQSDWLLMIPSLMNALLSSRVFA